MPVNRRLFGCTGNEAMTILADCWHSIRGGVKLTFLVKHGHAVLNPKQPDEDIEEAVLIAQVEFDKHQPDVVVGSSRGGAGLREYRRFHGVEIEEERSEAPEKPQPKFPRKKKQKGDSSEVLTVAASEESLVPAS